MPSQSKSPSHRNPHKAWRRQAAGGGDRRWTQRAVTLLMMATLVFGAGGLAACEAKATPEECESACANLKSVFLGVVERETAKEDAQKKMGATGVELARETASLFVEFLTRECTRQCNARSTRKVTECLRAAKSEDDIKRCYE